MSRPIHAMSSSSWMSSPFRASALLLAAQFFSAAVEAQKSGDSSDLSGSFKGRLPER